jgi:hypothetical protein
MTGAVLAFPCFAEKEFVAAGISRQNLMIVGSSPSSVEHTPDLPVMGTLAQQHMMEEADASI